MRLKKIVSSLLTAISTFAICAAKRHEAEANLLEAHTKSVRIDQVRGLMCDVRDIFRGSPIFGGLCGEPTECSQHACRTKAPREDGKIVPPSPPPSAPAPTTSPEAINDELDELDEAIAALGSIPWPGLRKMAEAFAREQGKLAGQCVQPHGACT